MRLLLFLLSVFLTSYSVASPTKSLEDVTTIDALMNAYYEVISGPAGGYDDVQRDKNLHHPDAQIIFSSRDESGKTVSKVMSLAEVHGERKPRKKDFYEWETSRRVERFGNMAHVWSSYASGPTNGTDPSSTGVNSVTLLWDGERWWIMNWMADYP